MKFHQRQFLTQYSTTIPTGKIGGYAVEQNQIYRIMDTISARLGKAYLSTFLAPRSIKKPHEKYFSNNTETLEIIISTHSPESKTMFIKITVGIYFSVARQIKIFYLNKRYVCLNELQGKVYINATPVRSCPNCSLIGSSSQASTPISVI